MNAKETIKNESLIYIITFVFILASYSLAFGDAIRVPSDYSTIQAGIDAASGGDAVIIADGTYRGNGNIDIDFKGKAITVESENGPLNCIIDCEGNGRGFYFHNGETESSILSGITITNGQESNGGGIRCSSSPIINNCRIIGNTATSSGGGIFFAVWSAKITNCVIAGNSAGAGGAIYVSNAKPEIINCTMIGNTATVGAIGISTNDVNVVPTIVNSILWDEPSIFYYGSFPYAPTISHCNINSTEIESSSIIHTDPKFVDVSGTFPLEWDLHIQSSSPCIDKGKNGVPNIPSTDFDGNQRIMDGDGDGNATVDIGADEYQKGADDNDLAYMLEDFEDNFVSVTDFGSIPSGWSVSGPQEVVFSKGIDSHNGQFGLSAEATYHPSNYTVLEATLLGQPGAVINLQIQAKAATSGTGIAVFDASYDTIIDNTTIHHFHKITSYWYDYSSTDWRSITLEDIEIPYSGELPVLIGVAHSTSGGSTNFDIDCLTSDTALTIRLSDNIDDDNGGDDNGGNSCFISNLKY